MKILLLVLMSLGLCQCTEVLPWQRGKLADYGMRPDRDQLGLALGEHVYFSREAAAGGRGIGGGGCGCN
ncbi:MAG: lipoprotein [Verrucomicrobiaceae bacterium]|nr:lipoprotein [Verrucomicrobiaceae bacterium]